MARHYRTVDDLRAEAARIAHLYGVGDLEPDEIERNLLRLVAARETYQRRGYRVALELTGERPHRTVHLRVDARCDLAEARGARETLTL